jgi:hypothetical protein
MKLQDCLVSSWQWGVSNSGVTNHDIHFPRTAAGAGQESSFVQGDLVGDLGFLGADADAVLGVRAGFLADGLDAGELGFVRAPGAKPGATATDQVMAELGGHQADAILIGMLLP